MGKADHKWSTQECLDQTKTLDITIDQIKDSARNNGQPPAAILVSRFIQSIARRCPNLAITLRFAHCQCDHTPVSGLDSETFPRVTKLVLFVGRHEERLPDRPGTMCIPNAKFWRPCKYFGVPVSSYESGFSLETCLGTLQICSKARYYPLI